MAKRTIKKEASDAVAARESEVSLHVESMQRHTLEWMMTTELDGMSMDELVALNISLEAEQTKIRERRREISSAMDQTARLAEAEAMLNNMDEDQREAVRRMLTGKG